MAKVFISYRREDSAGVVGRIFDRLRAHFGNDAVFMDIDSIPYGEDFREHVGAAVGQCDVVLAVIGPRWSGKTVAFRRIDDPRDFVRIEIELALQRGIPVIPVLLDRTRMPTEAEVPASLAKLTYRNAIEVDQGRDFHPHVDRLVKGIEFHIEKSKTAGAPVSSKERAPTPEAPMPNALEPAQSVTSAKTDQRSNQAREAEPRVDDSARISAPTDQPRDRSQVAHDIQPRTKATSGGTIGPVPRPRQTVVSSVQRIREVSTQLKDAFAKRRNVPWFRVYVAAVPLLAVLGVLIYIVTDNGTVKITGTDERMKVSVDGKEIRIENLGQPIALRTGTHYLLVRSDGLTVKSDAFDISRGQEKVLEVTYMPKAPEAATNTARKEPDVAGGAAPPASRPEPGPFSDAATKPAKAAASTKPSPPGAPEYITAGAAGIKLKLIPAGEFDMGSDDSDPMAEDDEGVLKHGKKSKHRVRITQPFYLGVIEVTRGQFRSFVDETAYKTEAEKDGRGGFGWDPEEETFRQDPKFTWRKTGFEPEQTDEHPVVNVSWVDAVAFCEWLKTKERQPFRLPTEAEWEYACRAGTTTRYSSGDDPETLVTIGNVADVSLKERFPNGETTKASDGYLYTSPAGRFRANAFGLYDMLGNVWEWCQDWYDEKYYNKSPQDDPICSVGPTRRVFRGGSWSSNPRYCRSAYRRRFVPASRFWNEPAFRSSLLGFRVARGQSQRSKSEDVPNEEPPGVVGSESAKNGPKSPPERVDARNAEAALKATSHQPAKTSPAPAERTASAKAADTAPHGAFEIISTVAGRIELKLIPAGEFMMGSGEGQDADERPHHRVRITRAFYVGVYEVTQGQYAAVTGKNPSYFCSSAGGKDKVAGASTDSHPVEYLSRLDALVFCNKLSEKEGLKSFYRIERERVTVPDWSGEGYRLLTEAEWEYACGGDPADLGEAAWYGANAGGCTHPVGQKRSNRFGLCDMLGNVWEWCWDGWDRDYYKQSPSVDPRGPIETSYQVIRGGSWGSNPRYCRSASRDSCSPGSRSSYLGFRVARGQSQR
jgi:formylglycine-generating enzyme required for sulfatase activity